MEKLLEAVYILLPACAKNLLKVLLTGPFDWPGGISAPEQTFPEQHSVASVQEGSGFVFFVPGFLFRVSPSLTVERLPLYFSQTPPNQSQMSEPSVEFWERVSGPE